MRKWVSLDRLPHMWFHLILPTMLWSWSLSPMYRWGTWDLERLSNMLEVKELERGGRVFNSSVWFQVHAFNHCAKVLRSSQSCSDNESCSLLWSAQHQSAWPWPTCMSLLQRQAGTLAYHMGSASESRAWTSCERPETQVWVPDSARGQWYWILRLITHMCFLCGRQRAGVKLSQERLC